MTGTTATASPYIQTCIMFAQKLHYNYSFNQLAASNEPTYKHHSMSHDISNKIRKTVLVVRNKALSSVHWKFQHWDTICDVMDGSSNKFHSDMCYVTEAMLGCNYLNTITSVSSVVCIIFTFTSNLVRFLQISEWVILTKVEGLDHGQNRPVSIFTRYSLSSFIF